MTLKLFVAETIADSSIYPSSII